MTKGTRLLLSRGCEDLQEKDIELSLGKAETKWGVSNCPNLSVPVCFYKLMILMVVTSLAILLVIY